ncbi:hypothetical protein TNCV_3733211 [Trichonephila clavipes]|nr:hypothetical protein TNCV_3733211 [Trichonephila clavipes]
MATADAFRYISPPIETINNVSRGSEGRSIAAYAMQAASGYFENSEEIQLLGSEDPVQLRIQIEEGSLLIAGEGVLV